MDSISAVVPFAIAGSILPTWTAIVIGLLGTERPLLNAGAFVFGNFMFRLGLGAALILFSAALPDSGSLRLDSGNLHPFVPLGIGLALLGSGVLVWRRPPAPEGRTLIDRVERIHPGIALVTGVAMVASPGVQYAYFVGGIAAITESVSDTGTRLLMLAGFAAALQWMLIMPIAIYLVFRGTADRILSRTKTWLRANSQRLGGGVLIVVGAYLAVFALREIIG